jgi:uncharacterized membrane protein YdcZ (DUF606 family)
VAATISGQLAGAWIAGRLGIIGLERIRIKPSRLAGTLLLGIGTYLVAY